MENTNASNLEVKSTNVSVGWLMDDPNWITKKKYIFLEPIVPKVNN